MIFFNIYFGVLMENYYMLSLGFFVSINLLSANISLLSQSPTFSPIPGQNVEMTSYEEELISSVEFLDAQSITRSFFSNLMDSEYFIEDFEKELKNKTYSSFLMDNKLLFHPAIVEVLQLYPRN